MGQLTKVNMINQTEDALDWVQQRGAGALAAKMGIEFLEFSIERAVARMPVEGNTQPAMLMHGGAYVVLGESLGSMAANLFAGEGRLAVGIEINAHAHPVGDIRFRDGRVHAACTSAAP